MTGHGDCLACRLAGRGRGDVSGAGSAPHAEPVSAEGALSDLSVFANR
ncbi:hypothetical protein AB0L30_35060 [Microbispora rosea]